MDASQYKDYVLTLLFMKYVSDKYDGKPDALIDVPEGGGFADMVKLKGDKEIGDKINKIIAKLAEANDLKGVIDVADFNDEDKLGRGKDMQDKLSKLVAIFGGLDFRANRAEGDDLLGDAYEYLMRNFATESGKSKGQFYTPAEVSRIMAKVVGIGRGATRDQTIYDPTCGSGSLLLKAADEAPRGLTIYGQEMDNATWALAKMNMILHSHETADLWRDNTLAAPHFKNSDGQLKTFDFAVANPPFSTKAWSSGLDPEHDEFHRFEGFGVPPAKNGDYAFLLQVVKSLKSTGKGAVILPHGVLFRGNREADIRRNLIKRGLIKGVIGLPANLFYGTGIPACVVVVDKENAQARTGVFMIDASKGFIKDGPKNRLRAQDIHKIVDVFIRQMEVEGYSRMVPVSEVANPVNDYNLNIPRYIDSSGPEDIQDLDAHLNGGIPERDVNALEVYWRVLPSLRDELFEPADRSGYVGAKIEASEVKAAILTHAEYRTYAEEVDSVFQDWRGTSEPLLRGLKEGDLPRELIEKLSEDLLSRFARLPLLSRYDAYQRLMDYWVEAMQDDVYLIAAEGWIAAAKPRAVIDDKEKRIKESADLKIDKAKYKMDLIPPGLVVARFFSTDKVELEDLERKRNAASIKLEEFVEEHAVDEGLLADTRNEKGAVTKTLVMSRLKSTAGVPALEDEHSALSQCLDLMETDAASKKAVSATGRALDVKALAKYEHLSEGEIIELVVVDKWLASIAAAIDSEVERLTQSLAERVVGLEERYASTLPELESECAALFAKVEDHLQAMGLVWA